MALQRLVAAVALLAGAAHGERHAVRPHGGARRIFAPLAAAWAIGASAAEEPISMHRMLEKLDTDRNGLVELDEYLDAARRLLETSGEQNAAVRAHVLDYYGRLFERADIDSSDDLSKREVIYAEYLARAYGPESVDFGEEDAAELLKSTDKDGNGFLDWPEFVHGLTWMWAGILEDSEVAKYVVHVFAGSDIDQDEQLSDREVHFAALVINSAEHQGMFQHKLLATSIYEDLDHNGDGFVDRDELRQRLAEYTVYRAEGLAEEGEGKSIIEHIRERFDDADVDADGRLGREEVDLLAAQVIKATKGEL